MTHKPGGIVLEKPDNDYCQHCGQPWPCTHARRNASHVSASQMHERTDGHHGRTHEETSNFQPRMTLTYAHEKRAKNMRCMICDNRLTIPERTRTLCDRCLNRISDNLQTIETLTKAAKGWTRRHGNTRLIGVASSNPPLSISLLDAALGLTALNILEAQEKTARRCLDLVPYGPASAARNRDNASTTALFSVIAWLTSNLARLAETPTYLIEELHHEAQQLAASLTALDPATDVSHTIINCPADHPDQDGTSCSQRLRINPEELGALITCHNCKTVWTVDRLCAVALSIPDVEVWCEGEWIRKYFGIHQTTLNQWVKDGRITKRGELYSIPDAMRTAASTRI